MQLKEFDMRKVDRSAVPVPNNLQNLTAINQNHLVNYNNISSAVYGHKDVKASLERLYYEKCYICECDVSLGSYDVEHYLPKKNFSNLGYTWSNLHKACQKCNLAKERKEFEMLDANGKYVDIKLLDPSNPSYDINDYIRFNINSKVEPVIRGTNPTIMEKARNTIHYLNGKGESAYGRELPYLRDNRANKFLRYCGEFLIEQRARLKTITMLGDEYSPPEDMTQFEIDQKICEGLTHADLIFLSDKAPFSTNVRGQLFSTLKINYKSLVSVKEKLQLELQM
jgi:uncharacterized protein (TIGR02646 family)